ncbi:hypothetical protein NKJ81_30485 [Mesorhizobium sp. M0018]|uniref:hypothetical protein n=1 Tax=Mesorhizobium sp. M0018 TaxID=2956844 RepID=UPI003335D25E
MKILEQGRRSPDANYPSIVSKIDKAPPQFPDIDDERRRTVPHREGEGLGNYSARVGNQRAFSGRENASI